MPLKCLNTLAIYKSDYDVVAEMVKPADYETVYEHTVSSSALKKLFGSSFVTRATKQTSDDVLVPSTNDIDSEHECEAFSPADLRFTLCENLDHHYTQPSF